jgi:ubiquitin C-terminal hydrolase
MWNDNLYFCDKCKDKRIASKKTEISNWPKHLIVVLKRFNYEGRSQKINKEIEIPIEWRHNYELQGIVYHSGSTFGGHYIYIHKHNNKWLMFNDNDIKEINKHELNNYKNYGYIFYYIQK